MSKRRFEAQPKTVQRELQKAHHPNAGGNPEDFKRLRRACEAGLGAREQKT